MGASVSDAGNPSGLDRRAAVAALLEERRDLLVVSGLGSPSYDVFAAGDHNGNFYLWGAMGGAAMVGLGLALAQPQRPVAVITGDGEQLMALGALATIGTSAASNLSIVVLDNGEYGETGGQPSHTARGADLCAIARGAGFSTSLSITDYGDIPTLRAAIQERSGGPRFARMAIQPGEKPKILPPRDGVFLKTRFRAHLDLAVT
jgi:thiamine pyrophosphate-dependent acetolactate synthase large subunit-like protein